jgi:hypothetical protein
MLYRIVILNGERRGERVDVPETPFILGRAPACGLTLNDAALEPVHAELTQSGESLLIRSGNPGAVIRVNDAEVTESVLQHGDVVEIGTTRFFIQQSGATTWENLSRLRKYRTLLTIVLPVLVAGIIMALVSHNRIQPGSESAPVPRPLPASPSYPTNDPDQNDFVVTNIPRILIHPSITLTSRPPEVVEAVDLLISVKTNTYPDTDEARKELAGATLFLEQAGELPPRAEADATGQSEADLKAAQGMFTNEPAPLLRPVVPEAGTNSTSTNAVTPAP